MKMGSTFNMIHHTITILIYVMYARITYMNLYACKLYKDVCIIICTVYASIHYYSMHIRTKGTGYVRTNIMCARAQKKHAHRYRRTYICTYVHNCKLK